MYFQQNPHDVGRLCINVLSLGREDMGLLGLEELIGIKTNYNGTDGVNCIGGGCGDGEDTYKTDAYGRNSGEKKWKFKLGVSEKTYMFIVELGTNFIPGWGSAVGAYQDLRDLAFGDSLIDRELSINSDGHKGLYRLVDELAFKQDKSFFQAKFAIIRYLDDLVIGRYIDESGQSLSNFNVSGSVKNDISYTLNQLDLADIGDISDQVKFQTTSFQYQAGLIDSVTYLSHSLYTYNDHLYTESRETIIASGVLLDYYH